MARVPYADPPRPGTPDPGGLRELYAEASAARGSVLDLYRAIANSPGALRAYLGLSRYVRDGASLDPRLRELAILATAHALRVEYEIVHHERAGRAAGLTEAQLAAFPGWREAAPGTFGPAELAVLAYADQVAATRRCDDATFAALERALPRADLLDLVLTVAFYHLCAAVIGPLGIEPER